ncbi:hypothetical protein [Mycobacterium avium]|nr:hypothetical protein [Mycobacterium avium]
MAPHAAVSPDAAQLAQPGTVIAGIDLVVVSTRRSGVRGGWR